MSEYHYILGPGDALIVVDVQNDFLPGGALAVPDGDAVVVLLNGYIEQFKTRGLPVVATRDWHPPDHCSFIAQGGPWPPHCIANSHGAEFSSQLRLPPDAEIISKADTPQREAYSAFDGTTLHNWLIAQGGRRIFVGGLATDYSVRRTVLDGMALGYQMVLLQDAVRAVNVAPEDGDEAVAEMRAYGAAVVQWDELV